MKKTIVKTVILAGLFLLCLQPLMAASPYTRPSDGARSNMQEMIDIGNRSARNWKDCKDREAAARKRGDEEMAKRWKDLADKYADLYFETRRAVVRWVDDMWNIPKPPNTTVFFDPNCKGKFGWCGGTKTDIKVGICPADFTDGPDLIASTKIHEMKHAWQIHNCMSSNAGYWKDCTYWGHLSEWEAYKESEKAHDEGIIKLEEEHKKRITEKIKEHQEGTDKARDKPVTTTGGGDKKEVADQTIEVPFTIHNPTDTAIEVTVRIKQDEAWPLLPLVFPPQIIGPEGEVPGTLMVTIPFDTPPYTCNPIEVSADGYTSDVVFITCVPSVEVLGGPPASGSSGDTVPVSFTVENRGLVADTFDLSVSNPLGWACAITSPIPPQVNLPPGAIMSVQATINIEAAPTTFTTNLL
ncbi:MAG TPA: hypothetical protein PLB62_06825, partial [Candidatus Sumerlaeota bacterium]|nr:hypothetical protein [Candidatus Sumerlaeota bacterium]